jgi:serine/threonine-protein kinase
VGLPERFGDYVLEDKIASGGMAEVYRAREQSGAGRYVCIKRILPAYSEEENFARMFRDEAAIMARMRHPNLVAVYDFGEVEGQLYLAMELVDGLSLGHLIAQHIRSRLALEIPVVAEIAMGICGALDHAHRLRDDDGRPLGVVHRDVSPQNVLISDDGEVKLVDFGVAKSEGRLASTRTGMTKGKVPYMSPEQALGQEIDHRSDQFSVGILLWEMVVGRRLFRAKNDFQVMRRITKEEVPPPSTLRGGVPDELDRIVARALSKNATQRFPSMAALEEALAGLQSETAATPADYDLRPVVLRVTDQKAMDTERIRVGTEDVMSAEPTQVQQDAYDTEPMLEAMGFERDEG